MDYYSSLDPNALDPDNPTIFEILSARQLQDLVSPSLRYILVHYAQRNPQYLLKIVNKYDELYALLMLVVEYNHLKNWNSSFTEKFYGLKRSRTLQVNPLNTKLHAPQVLYPQSKLSKRQIYASLFFLVAVPYMKEKLDARYDILKGRYAFRSIEEARQNLYDDPTASTADKVRFEVDRIIYNVYPIVTSASSLVTLAFYLGYLFSKTTATGPADLLIGFKYTRFNQFDYREEERRKLAGLGTNFGRVRSAITGTLSYALPTSMFLLKFLEWWSQSEFAHQLSKNGRNSGDEDLPEPEKPAHVASEEGSCPLCSKTMENPTAIETGVVFCYRCIFDYLQDGDEKTGGHCPVTGQRLLLCRWKDGIWEVGGLRRLVF